MGEITREILETVFFVVQTSKYAAFQAAVTGIWYLDLFLYVALSNVFSYLNTKWLLIKPILLHF